jgi:exopolysaccharide biosynthesis operon protein EpsL
VVKPRKYPAPGLALIATAAALGFGAPAHALEGDRIKISPFFSYAYDSNVFRLPDEFDAATFTGQSERSDRIFSTGLRVALDYPVSRQRFLADARVTRNDFDTFTFLDNTAYDGRLLWRWQLGNDWSGDAGYTYSRALTSFGDFRVPVKNLETRHQPYLSAQYRFAASHALRSRVSYLTTDNSAAIRKPSDLEQTTYELGYDFLPATLNRIGTTFRHTEGEYPSRAITSLNNSFTKDDIEANIYWRLTGQSVVTGAVGYTTHKFDNNPQSDFDGPTGRLTWEYTPTGKLRFTTVGRREIVASEDVNSSHAITDSLGLSADWAATARILVGARIEFRKRDFLTDSVVLAPGRPQRTDDTTSLALTATWKPYRFLELFLALAHEKRSSNVALSDYDANTASFTAQLTF